jgi:DNA-binding ferritin-like protein
MEIFQLLSDFFQILKHLWLVEGPDWKHIHLALDEYANSISAQAVFNSERIVALGRHTDIKCI